jgi:hypothetical protein
VIYQVDLMLDLETLGTTSGSVVTAIGIAASDGAEFYEHLPVLEQLYLGLTVSPDTMSWWRSQSPEVWAQATLGTRPLREVLTELRLWIMKRREGAAGQETGNKIRIWGDSVSFDCGLLAAVHRAASVVVPWDYREEFCYRTERTLADSEKPRSKVQHDALSDAKAQLKHLQTLLDERATAKAAATLKKPAYRGETQA